MYIFYNVLYKVWKNMLLFFCVFFECVFFYLLRYFYDSINKRMKYRVRVMVFNATFNNISVISWQSVLFTGGKYLNDRIISLIGKVWVHKTSLTRHFFFIEVPVPSPESERSYICVRDIDFCLFLWFIYWILELFRQCGVFFSFSFYYSY